MRHRVTVHKHCKCHKGKRYRCKLVPSPLCKHLLSSYKIWTKFDIDNNAPVKMTPWYITFELNYPRLSFIVAFLTTSPRASSTGRDTDHTTHAQTMFFFLSGSLVPVLYESVPSARCNLGGLVGMPGTTNAHRVMGLELTIIYYK